MKLHALTFLLLATLAAGAETTPSGSKSAKKPASKSTESKPRSGTAAGKTEKVQKPAVATPPAEPAAPAEEPAVRAAEEPAAAVPAEPKAPDPKDEKAVEEKPAEPAPVVTLPGFDLNSIEAPAEFASRFFGRLQRGDVDGAYDGLIKGSKIAEHPEEGKALKAKTREAIAVFGAVIGFELVESKEVGEHLLRRTYVSIGKQFPLRWRFYFYKPDQSWRLVDMRVDDRLAGIFGESEENRSPDAKP